VLRGVCCSHLLVHLKALLRVVHWRGANSLQVTTPHQVCIHIGDLTLVASRLHVHLPRVLLVEPSVAGSLVKMLTSNVSRALF